MTTPVPGSEQWRAQVDEPVVDPEQRIVDPHHHLWPPGGPMPYSVDDLLADVGSGHRVEHTVFMECQSSYRSDGPAELGQLPRTEDLSRIISARSPSSRSHVTAWPWTGTRRPAS